jgi:hypothetical protein
MAFGNKYPKFSRFHLPTQGGVFSISWSVMMPWLLAFPKKTMNKSTVLLLILGVLLGLAGLIRVLAGFMFKAEVKSLQYRFEIWWQSFSNIQKDELPCAFLAAANRQIDQFFGYRLRSFESFKRSAKIAFPLLLCTLCLFELFTKDQFLTTPWTTYRTALQIMEKHASQMPATKNPKEQEYVDKIANVAADCDTTAATIVFSILFYAALWIIALCGFYVAVILSRRMLRSLAATKDRFVIVGLTGFVAAVTLITVTACMFMIGVIGNPALWLTLVAEILVSLLSFKLTLLIVIETGVFTWVFSPLSLVIMCLIIFSPLLVSLLILASSMLAHSAPATFHALVRRVLKLCTEQNPIVVFSSIVLVVGGLLTAIIRLLCLLF